MPSKSQIDKMTQVAIKVTHSQLEQVIIKYYKSKRALFIWGTMGIGKSHVIRQAARTIAAELKKTYTEDLSKINDENYFLVIDVRLSQCDPSDLRGIPVWDKDKGATRWLPPSTFPRAGYGIILFDELNLSPPLVQASAYQFILDRRLGEYIVPEGYSVIGAGNRLEDRANVFEMAAPLSNRMGHVQLDPPSVDDWTVWAAKHDIDPRVMGYLNFKQGSLFAFDPTLKEKSFGTPRSWEFVSDLIKDIPTENLPLLKLYVGSLVGEGEATSFTGFLKLREELAPIAEYFKKPETIAIPEKVDLQWALITSIAEYYKAHNTDATLLSMVKLLKRFSEEYAVFTLKLAYAIDPSIQSKLQRIPEATNLAQKLWKFIM